MNGKEELREIEKQIYDTEKRIETAKTIAWSRYCGGAFAEDFYGERERYHEKVREINGLQSELASLHIKRIKIMANFPEAEKKK